MKIIRKMEDIRFEDSKTGVALGTFDGLHIGHQHVIKTLIQECKKKNLKSVVYTFSNHPREFTNKDNLPNRILTLDEKISHFEELGVDELILIEFDSAQMNIEANDFIVDFLMNRLNMSHLVVGFNFCFGKGASGNIDILKDYSNRYQFGLTVVESINIDDMAVSSTLIRKLLSEGEMERTNLFLGRNYTVAGQVVKGKQVGSKLGFPTANLRVTPNMTLLKSGVYVSLTHIDGRVFKSVTNVGFNPTFNQNEFNLETYIFDFSEDIYHKYIVVEILHRIRDEIKYTTLEALKEQIDKDVEYTKEFFDNRDRK